MLCAAEAIAICSAACSSCQDVSTCVEGSLKATYLIGCSAAPIQKAMRAELPCAPMPSSEATGKLLSPARDAAPQERASLTDDGLGGGSRCGDVTVASRCA